MKHTLQVTESTPVLWRLTLSLIDGRNISSEFPSPSGDMAVATGELLDCLDKGKGIGMGDTYYLLHAIASVGLSRKEDV